MLLAREYLGRLLRRRDPQSLEAALHLVTPPFALAVLSILLGAGIFAIVSSIPLLLASLTLVTLLALTLAISLVQARARLRTWLALLIAPAYILWKVWVQARAVAVVLRREKYFAPTARD